MWIGCECNVGKSWMLMKSEQEDVNRGWVQRGWWMLRVYIIISGHKK